MVPFLNRYPDREAARLLELDFRVGFHIPCRLNAVPPLVKNICSAFLQSEVVSEKLFKEVSLGRMSGPFSLCHFQV